MGRPDPNSFANIDEITQTHLHFEWEVDFASQVISGSVLISAVVLKDGVTEFVCDNRCVCGG